MRIDDSGPTRVKPPVVKKEHHRRSHRKPSPKPVDVFEKPTPRNGATTIDINYKGNTVPTDVKGIKA